MVHESLVTYIKQSLQAGTSRDQIQQTLIQTGWQQGDIDDSFVAAVPTPQIPEVPNAPVASTPITLQPNQQPYYHEQSNGASKKKWLLLLIPLFMLIGVGGVLGYQMYTETPERILDQMIEQSKSIKTLSTKADMTVVLDTPVTTQSSSSADLLPQQPNQKMNINLSWESISDASNLESPKSSLTIFGEMKDSTGKEGILLEAEMRTLGNILYARILDFATGGQKMLPQYENKWIKIDSDKLQEQYQIKKTETKQLSQDDLDKIAEIFADSEIMKDLKRLKDEQIDGKDMYHMSFDIDKDELKRVVSEVLVILVKETSKEQKENFEKEFSKFLNDLTFGTQNMWIGKSDKYMYKYDGSLKYVDSVSKASLDSRFTLNMKDHNKPVTIEVPSNSIDFDELLKEIYGTPTDGTLPPADRINSPVLGDRTSSVSAQMEQEQSATAQLLNIFYLNDDASKILRK